MPEPSVYVVDDDEAVRDSLGALLQSAGYRTAVFSGAKKLLEAMDGTWAGCIIADVRMPEMDGLELQQELVRRACPLPVIIVTGHGDIPLAVRAMKAGAADFLEKPFDDTALLESVGRAIAKVAHAADAARLREDAARRVAQLTDRERDVLAQLIAGRQNKMIAFKLAISPRTVEVHRARVMEKMRAHSLSELVRLALAAGVEAAAD
jgi:two-component system response regulator FixJ